MKVSVIIPTFNRKKVLGRAISSVLSQTYADLELIIIDDGSDDGTNDLVNTFDDPRLSYVKIKNSGVSAARNVGVKMSSCKWLAFLDSDDEWLPHKLQKQIDLLNDNPQLKLIHGEEIWVRRGKRVNQKKIHKKFAGFIFDKCLKRCLISPSASFMSKGFLLEVGGWDEDFIVCEDFDLWLKMTSLHPVGFIEDPIIIKYGGHEDQLSAKYHSMDYWRIRSLEKILEIRDFKIDVRNLVVKEIIYKAEILKKGMIKHENTLYLDYVERILDSF